nr:hypothetical protein CFP56_63154 [Quercus suber]
MIEKGPVAPGPIQRLVTHKDYVVKMVSSIIKETNLDPCGEHSSEDWGFWPLQPLKGMSPSFTLYFKKVPSDFNRHAWFLALVHMKAL